MKLYKELKIKLNNGYCKIKYFWGIPFVKYEKIYNNDGTYFKKYHFAIFEKEKSYPDKKIKQGATFYLKINRNIPATYKCFQQWMNVIYKMNSDFYIICDNENLKENILKNVFFKSTNIKFLKSTKNNTLKKIIKKQKIDKKWKNAAFSHLTVFHHALKNNIPFYFNIDADDALFLTSDENIVNILSEAQKYADTNKLDALSFDFWGTKTLGRHWSFGITYIKNNPDYLNYLNNNIINWHDYGKWTSVHNIDWIFTHLNNINKLKLKTFYVENLYFIHFGDFVADLKNAFIARWHNGNMSYPILTDIFNAQNGCFNIPKDIVKLKLNIQINQDECQDYFVKYFLNQNRQKITEEN